MSELRPSVPPLLRLGDCHVARPLDGPLERPFAYLLGGLPQASSSPDLVVRSRWVERVSRRDAAPLPAEREIFADDARGRLDHSGAWLESDTLYAQLSADAAVLRFDAIREERPPNYDAAFLLFAIGLHARGWTHLHAGGVELPDGRVAVVAGGTGDGKSTTVLSLALHGCAWGTDDACFVRPAREGVEVAFVPRVFQLRPRTVEAFPALEPLLVDVAWRYGARRALDPLAIPGTRSICAAERVDVLVLPRVTRTPTTGWRTVDAAEAMMRLLPNIPYASIDGIAEPERVLDVAARLAGTGAIIELQLGWDALEEPAVVLRTLEQALR